ncbi:MAG: antibiotic biosynthesis monooxygenase [Candidatus Pacebacteria bacterium]|nr:antibiotic biosynthesis monooxygenase [Candidatus Paceibacterota bacterium]MCF7857300.1 antibiotic biosynthesis monooxygenase [Candidatus Paceibacterota bacterium]
MLSSKNGSGGGEKHSISLNTFTMVTVVYRVLAKKGKERQFEKIALKCVECAHESKNCISYAFFKSLTNSREFLVYYKFASKKAQDVHIENLHKKIRPAENKRGLPDKFLSLLDEEEVVLLKLK